MNDRLLDYAIRIQSIAQAGLQYGKDKYDRERYAELREIAAEMISAKTDISMEKVRDLCARADGKIDVMSGDDGLTLDFMSAGAKGVVSVASNIIPEAMSNFVKLIEEGRLDEARAVNEKLSGFFKALFIEPNPVPAKTALHLCGRIPSDFVRLPLCRMQPQNLDVLKKEMEKLELI